MAGVVIIGAGLGGLRVAETLRASGYAGEVTIVGDEIHLPYNRPPLSKEALAGGVEVADLEFRRKAHVDDVTWKLGSPAVTSSINEGTVTLADGTVLQFDALAVAAGIRPRRLPIPGPQTGRVVLRTAEDARELRAALVPGAKVLIMGAGFIGCEVAATARKVGCEVNIVALDAEPMIRPLGAELGAGMRRRHEANGVNFYLGRTVTSFNGDDRVESATLDDGTVLPADIVVEAVGSVANVEWLDGNGLDLGDGLSVDDAMIVDGTTNVVAVGDIARHHNALFSGPKRRIEHWNMPTETGKRAGQTLAALLAGERSRRLRSLRCHRSGPISTATRSSPSACQVTPPASRSLRALPMRHASLSTSTTQAWSVLSESTRHRNSRRIASF
jgi:3-phenylpropionate/trans-cinnamate dioxygenase ferredoxin reductase component